MKLNERAWAGQIIAWIKEEINAGTTLFQDATNDAGIIVESGRTKFPDILLFTDKASGIVFNGWELKYPDTPVDDIEMLVNALEKAQKLKSDSFVTWNGAEAIIWKVKDKDYSATGIERVKIYPKEIGINSRNDLSDPTLYSRHEQNLRKRLKAILHDLESLLRTGVLKEAINISENFINAVEDAGRIIIPQLYESVHSLKGIDDSFKDEFGKWKINESATLKILGTSSRRAELIIPEEVLAKFTYYKIIGKILFYLTLSENLSGKIPSLDILNVAGIQGHLDTFFDAAKQIDYQAVFENDFTDAIVYTDTIEKALFDLIKVFGQFDFKILPTEVIGTILENLVPKNEKQRFGQYFTPELLANLVTFSAIRTRNDLLADPTSGTGTFLNAFYQALVFLGNKNHQQILNQIWGNDVSHFPATLSVINLYKQKVSDVANFPRVIRRDFFTLRPGEPIPFPDNRDIDKINSVAIPLFDAIISNFPFIQQEDIPNDALTNHFKAEFQTTQAAFMNGKKFAINERSDYYIHCFYQSFRFLKPNGMLAAITSNAWLGKNYGLQFKRFLLDNFHIKYIVRSNAGHWFKDSKVSTIFITLRRGQGDAPTKFITINGKLDSLFGGQSLQAFEDFYADINNCDSTANTKWKKDAKYPDVYERNDSSARVSIVDRSFLIDTHTATENWSKFFISADPFAEFRTKLINPSNVLYTSGRGTKTRWDKLHIISDLRNRKLGIEKKFLLPILKSSEELSQIDHSSSSTTSLFICDEPLATLKALYPGAYRHVLSFEKGVNKKGQPLVNVLKDRKPFWYTLSSEDAANIFISISPSDKLFFSYTSQQVFCNQRLVAIRVNNELVKIVAALLNSVVSLLFVEINGVERNMGALDLNADFFKTKMRVFNPALLSAEQKKDIISKFEPLSKRVILSYKQEYKQGDRKAFDKAVLTAFGYNASLLPKLYDLLTETIRNRVEMQNR